MLFIESVENANGWLDNVGSSKSNEYKYPRNNVREFLSISSTKYLFTIFTTLVTGCAILPSESVTLYWIVYVPIILIFTLLVTTILLVKSPPFESLATAPLSIYGEVLAWFIILAPFIAMTGIALSTINVLLLSVVFPAKSETDTITL